MTDAKPVRSPIPLATHSLTVLVPAFNEESNLEPTIDRLLRALRITVEDFEIIIVNDGSTDGTAAVADRCAARHPQIRVVHNERNMGLGYSYVRGVALSRMSHFVYIPADNTWPYRSFLELMGNMGKADVVTSYSINPQVRPLARRIVSRMYTRLLNLLYGHRLHYYNGLTIYPLSFLRTNPVTTYGFGFQAEALLKAVDHGLSFVEVALPIDERTAGRSKAVTLKNIVNVATTVFRVYKELRLTRNVAMDPRAAGRLIEGDRTVLSAAETSGAPFSETSPASRRMSATTGALRIIISGASSGIGAKLVEALVADGHGLFVCARRGALLDVVTRQQTIAQGRVCDVSDEEQVKNFLAWVLGLTSHVDVLINCAGRFGAIGPLDTTDSAEWLDTIRVNLFGTYLMVKYTLPLLAKSSDPRILNFSGGGAFSPFPNYSAYACSKAAVVRLTECLGTELASRGIAVNAIAPGFVATEAHQATVRAGADRAGSLHFRRTEAILDDGGAQMTSVIDCVRTLLSPETRGLTGKTISVNFDPWRTKAFMASIPGMTRSDLYTMRRLNVVNLPEGSLRTTLTEAWAKHEVVA